METHKDFREIILYNANEIALNRGISEISIRAVAKKSGVSVGTVYNYYPSKAEIVVAVIEKFWKEAFEKLNLITLNGENFIEKFQNFYIHLYDYLHNFKQNWLEQISLLNKNVKKLGKKREEEYFSKIRTLIVLLMDSDRNINEKFKKDGIFKEKIVEFIFDNMLLMLMKHEENIDFFISVLQKALYG